MNEAAKIVADSLTGNDFKTVIVNGEAYTIFPPSIKIICRAISYFSNIDIPSNANLVDIMLDMENLSENVLYGISAIIVGDADNYKKKIENTALKLKNVTPGELKLLMNTCISLIDAGGFFQCAALAQSVAAMAAKQR